MDCCFAGPQDSKMFREKIKSNILPTFEDLSYAGIFNEYYFDGPKYQDQEVIEAVATTAKTRDPYSNQMEYWINIGTTSKYDGEGVKRFGRPACKFVIVLDISGSMGSPFKSTNEKEQTTIIETAKRVMRDMLQVIKPSDYYSLVIFDNVSEVIQPLTKFEDIDKEMLEINILKLHARGGTNFGVGFKAAYDILNNDLENSKDFEKRIFFLTDAMPNQGETSPGGLFNMIKEAASKGIYSSIFGMGLQFNTELVDIITKNKGCAYYTINDAQEFKKLLEEDFDYMVFPIAFDFIIRTDCKVTNVYGSHETDPNTEGQLVYVSCIIPSNIDQRGVKGGVILLKLSEFFPQVIITLSYTCRDGSKEKKILPVSFKETEAVKDESYFQNSSIRKAILLTKFVTTLKELFNKEQHNEYQISQGAELTSLQAKNFSDERKQRLQSFKDHFIEEMALIGDQELDKELKILESLIEKISKEPANVSAFYDR